MLLLRRRDDHRGHLAVGDDGVVVMRMQVRAGRLGQRLGTGGITVGDGEKADRGVLCGQPRPQRADPPGTDHRNAQIPAFWVAAFHGGALRLPR
jgi:hypothetical protein